jgi:hypothetical protein
VKCVKLTWPLQVETSSRNATGIRSVLIKKRNGVQSVMLCFDGPADVDRVSPVPLKLDHLLPPAMNEAILFPCRVILNAQGRNHHAHC